MWIIERFVSMFTMLHHSTNASNQSNSNHSRRNLWLSRRALPSLDSSHCLRLATSNCNLQLQAFRSTYLRFCWCFHREELNHVRSTLARLVGVLVQLLQLHTTKKMMMKKQRNKDDDRTWYNLMHSILYRAQQHQKSIDDYEQRVRWNMVAVGGFEITWQTRTIKPQVAVRVKFHHHNTVLLLSNRFFINLSAIYIIHRVHASI